MSIICQSRLFPKMAGGRRYIEVNAAGKMPIWPSGTVLVALYILYTNF